MKKLWIMLSIVCFAMVGCNNELPIGIDDPFFEEAETVLITEETDVDLTEVLQESETKIGVGGGGICIHMILNEKDERIDSSYHSFDSRLIYYVGEEVFRDWIEEVSPKKKAAYEQGETTCPYVTIVEFKDSFDIPREVFEAAGGYDYNIDVIYSGTEAAEAYYTSERKQRYGAQQVCADMKRALAIYVEDNLAERYALWVEEKNTTGWWGSEAFAELEADKDRTTEHFTTFNGGIHQWSMAEFIDVFDIPRDVVDKIYEKYKNYCGYKGTVDIDGLFAKTRDASYYRNTAADLIDMQYFIFEEENAVAE